MKYLRFFIIIVIVCVLGGLALGVSGVYKSFDSKVLRDVFNSQQSVFFDNDFGISFHYPHAWKKELVPPNMAVLSDEKNMRIVVALQKLKNTSMLLEELTKKNLQEFNDSGQYGTKKINVVASGNATLAGLPGGELEYTTQENGTTMHGIQIWSVKNGKVYMVSMSVPEGEYKESVQTFKKMLESMKIQ